MEMEVTATATTTTTTTTMAMTTMATMGEEKEMIIVLQAVVEGRTFMEAAVIEVEGK